MARTGADRALSRIPSTSTATAATSSRSATRSGTTRGHQLWSHDAELQDHADGLAVGNFSGDPQAEPRVYAWGSDEGFLMFDRRGTILKHVRIGHAQTASVGKFLPDRPGLQLMCVNFWKNPGIVSLFDHDGNLLAQQEPIHSGSPMLPVNWRGDGQEFVLLSGNAREGGMIDGQLRRVVMFPDDGHPDLAAYVADLTGDARDEVILWDQERVWIYTQDRPFAGERVYAPTRNPDYNESNYRTVVSLPAMDPAGRKALNRGSSLMPIMRTFASGLIGHVPAPGAEPGPSRRPA